MDEIISTRSVLVNLPYNSEEDVTLSLTNLNDVATSYVMNKNFYRLLANDQFLASYNISIDSSTVNPYIEGIEYRVGQHIVYNVASQYSSNPDNKTNILVALVDTTEKPTEENIADYYTAEDVDILRRKGYHWAKDLITIKKDDPQYVNILRRKPLEDSAIPMLSAYNKSDFENVPADTYNTQKDYDYVVSSGYTKGTAVVLASNTTWTNESRLDGSERCRSEFTSWYRIYKSGYIEMGGITKPFSLTEQWNGSNGRTQITINFPIKAKCLNVKYNFQIASDENNFMTKYSHYFTQPSLVIYQITQGRRQAANYTYPNVTALQNAFPGNKLTYVTENNFSIYLSNESFDLDNGNVGMTDASLTKISWKASGILV